MSTWIFQSNPKGYNLNAYLLKANPIQWTIRQRQYKDTIQIGDDVYIWRADGNEPGSGGIVAKGKITSLPELAIDRDPQYWKTQQSSPVNLYVDIEISEIRLSEEEMIRRVDLKEDERINDLTILNWRTATNYKLDRRQSDYLRQLWNRK